MHGKLLTLFGEEDKEMLIKQREHSPIGFNANRKLSYDVDEHEKCEYKQMNF